MKRIGLLLGVALLAANFTTACTVDTTTSDVTLVQGPVETTQENCNFTHCSETCNGSYGYLCMFGSVCDPVNHRCEHTSPSAFTLPADTTRDERVRVDTQPDERVQASK